MASTEALVEEAASLVDEEALSLALEDELLEDGSPAGAAIAAAACGADWPEAEVIVVPVSAGASDAVEVESDVAPEALPVDALDVLESEAGTVSFDVVGGVESAVPVPVAVLEVFPVVAVEPPVALPESVGAALCVALADESVAVELDPVSAGALVASVVAGAVSSAWIVSGAN